MHLNHTSIDVTGWHLSVPIRGNRRFGLVLFDRGWRWFIGIFSIETSPTPEQMRAMGYAADARAIRLSDAAFACFCAWVNVSPERVPKISQFHPPSTAEAWERVARAAKEASGR